MKPVFGLDFGTTNCALSVLENDNVRVLNIGHNNLANTLRSVLLFFEDNVFVGEEAVEKYLSNHQVGRFMQSIKSILPSTNIGLTKINSNFYSPEELVSIVLREIKERGEQCLGQEVNDVVIGRPVIFSDNKSKDKIAESRLTKAAQLAGFKNIFFQIEPVAAALTFEKTMVKNSEKIVFIGDFGGGTSDFSVIRLRGQTRSIDRTNDILSVGGIYKAGEAFDSHIMLEKISPYFGKYVKYSFMDGKMIDLPKHIIFELSNRHTMYRLRQPVVRKFIAQIKNLSDNVVAIQNLENLIDNDFGYLIFQEIEDAKIRLAKSKKSEIHFCNNYINIQTSIDLAEFNYLIANDVKQIADCLDLTLQKSGLKRAQIDEVFITGGTSQTVAINELLISRFGKNKINQIDAFTSVAHGLGESAKYFFT